MPPAEPQPPLNVADAVEVGEVDAAPARIGILVVAYNAESTLASVLDRIPVGFRHKITKILVRIAHQ